MKRRLLAIFLSLVLMLSCVGVVTIAAEESNIVRVGTFSDSHNDATGLTNVFNSFYQLTNNGADLDGIVMNGDIIYMEKDVTPAASHYATLLANEKYQQMRNAGKLVFTMGNHEFPLGSGNNATLSAQAIAMFEEQTGLSHSSDTVLGGYHFISGGASNYSNSIHNQEEYLLERLNAALAEDPEKPVFLSIHYANYSSTFRSFLNSQPRIIVLSGHAHPAQSDPTSITQNVGGCTYVTTAHVSGGSNYGSAYASLNHSRKVSQAIMIEINPETNVVTLKRFYIDATNPTYLEAEDWVLDIPAMIKARETSDTSDDLLAYKYTDSARKEQSAAPVFPQGSEVTIDTVAAESVQITFPEANQGEPSENSLVKFYEISIYDLRSNQRMKTVRIISDFFLKESERRSEYTQTITGLSQNSSYKIDVCATTPYYKQSEKIYSAEFTTITEEVFESVTFDSNNTSTILTDDCVATPTTYKRNGYIQVPNTASTHTYTFKTTIKEPGMYRFQATKIGSGGAPTTMVIAKEDGTVLKTAEKYIATGSATTYQQDVPYTDIPIVTPGTYTVTWSRGADGDTVTLFGVKVGKFDALPPEYLEEYIIEKNASEYVDTSETVSGTPESFTLNTGGYVTWQVSPSYTGTFKLTYDQSVPGTTTVTSEGVTVSGNGITVLPIDKSTDGEIELQLFKHVTYNLTFKASSDATVVKGMKLVWQGDFTDLENNAYNFAYNTNTSLAYGDINASYAAGTVYFEKKIVVPYDANYTFSINAGLAATGDVSAYIERVYGGTVSVAGTGSIDTIANRVLFENVPLKAGTEYKVTLFNGKVGYTIKIQDLVFETSGEYLPDIDRLTFLATDYSTISGTLTADLYNQKQFQCLLDGHDLTYKLKPGAGTYKVYGYTMDNYNSTSLLIFMDNKSVGTAMRSSWGSSVTKQDLGTITVTDDEFTLKFMMPNTSVTTRTLFYRFELEAIDEPIVTMHSGAEASDLNKITSLGSETAVTAKAILPKDVDGKPIAMVIAIYKDDVLYKAGVYETLGNKNSVVAVTLDELELETGGNYSTKVFLLRGLDTLVPLYSLPNGGMIQTRAAQ